jgi:hypothetical protein
MIERGRWIVCLLALGLAACAGSNATYTPPTGPSVATERSVSAPFDTAWDAYVAELSKSFFVINNISKDSRIINVSFSTNKPSRYVDCGHTIRTSTHPATGKQTFSYVTADSAQYNAGVPGTNYLWTVTRTTNLEGRINVYMAPQGQQTLLRVNAKYVWSGSYSAISNLGQRDPGASFSADFSSYSSGQTSGGTDQQVTCYSNGTLEHELLSLI